jgi:hypothetical protein
MKVLGVILIVAACTLIFFSGAAVGDDSYFRGDTRRQMRLAGQFLALGVLCGWLGEWLTR